MKEETTFETLFQDTFAAFEVVPPSDVKVNIDRQIERSRNRKFIWMAGSVVLCFFFGIGLWATQGMVTNKAIESRTSQNSPKRNSNSMQKSQETTAYSVNSEKRSTAVSNRNRESKLIMATKSSKKSTFQVRSGLSGSEFKPKSVTQYPGSLTKGEEQGFIHVEKFENANKVDSIQTNLAQNTMENQLDTSGIDKVQKSENVSSENNQLKDETKDDLSKTVFPWLISFSGGPSFGDRQKSNGWSITESNAYQLELGVFHSVNKQLPLFMGASFGYSSRIDQLVQNNTTSTVNQWNDTVLLYDPQFPDSIIGTQVNVLYDTVFHVHETMNKAEFTSFSIGIQGCYLFSKQNNWGFIVAPSVYYKHSIVHNQTTNTSINLASFQLGIGLMGYYDYKRLRLLLGVNSRYEKMAHNTAFIAQVRNRYAWSPTLGIALKL
jgi:hypothetical protein